jgi:hypothetical protein
VGITNSDFTAQRPFATPARCHRRYEVPPSVDAVCGRTERAYPQVWRGLLDDARQAGLLRDQIDVMTAQTMLIAALNGIAYSWKPERQRGEEIRAAKQFVLHGLSDEMR